MGSSGPPTRSWRESLTDERMGNLESDLLQAQASKKAWQHSNMVPEPEPLAPVADRCGFELSKVPLGLFVLPSSSSLKSLNRVSILQRWNVRPQLVTTCSKPSLKKKKRRPILTACCERVEYCSLLF